MVTTGTWWTVAIVKPRHVISIVGVWVSESLVTLWPMMLYVLKYLGTYRTRYGVLMYYSYLPLISD